MIAFVCWLWKSSFPNDRDYRAEHVNVLRSSIARHFRRPHRFVCITDDTRGLDGRVEAFPMPVTRLEELRTLRPPAIRRNAQGEVIRRIQFPSCYRRLWMFSREAEQLGEWVFSLDLDCLVVGDLVPLVEGFPGNFVGWLREVHSRRPKPALAGAAYKLRTGSHPEVWDDFDPSESPRLAEAAGYSGSDQAWMSYKLLPTSDRMWTDADGLSKPQMQRRPSDRILFTAGYAPPWSEEYSRKRPWAARMWREQSA